MRVFTEITPWRSLTFKKASFLLLCNIIELVDSFVIVLKPHKVLDKLIFVKAGISSWTSSGCLRVQSAPFDARWLRTSAWPGRATVSIPRSSASSVIFSFNHSFVRYFIHTLILHYLSISQRFAIIYSFIKLASFIKNSSSILQW